MIQNSDVVVGSLYMRAQKIIKEAQVLFFAPPMIPGYSASTDIEVNMQDKTGGDLNKFFDVVNDYTAALEARPEIMVRDNTAGSEAIRLSTRARDHHTVLSTSN